MQQPSPNILTEFQRIMNRALQHHKRGELAQAEAIYRQIAPVFPRQAAPLLNLASICLNSNRPEEAITLYRNALELEPHLATAWTALGIALQQAGKVDEAMQAYKNATRHGKAPDAWYNLGTIEQKLGKRTEAKNCYKKALAIKPDYPQACSAYATILYREGDMEKAEHFARKALKLRPESWITLCNILQHKKCVTTEDPDIQSAEQALASPSCGEDDAAALHFSLGKAYDDCEAYDAAFGHYQKGNAIRAKTHTFDQEQHALRIRRMMDHFTRNYFTRHTGYGSDSQSPVFIVGMPRSGSTLVKHIITMHPEIAPVGEHPALAKVLAGFAPDKRLQSYPEHFDSLKPEDAAALAENYLAIVQEAADAYRPGTAHIANKMLDNYLWLGAIALLFPRASIIHCNRDPVDTCLSCYFQDFTGGHDFSYRFEDLAFFHLQHRQIMRHWHSVLPLPIYEISYEQLLEDPEKEIRAVLDFLQLPFDERCLNFHENKRPVHTASSWQVRQKLYTTSKERWRNYEKHLDPLLAVLGL